jgi:hypothetical protein
MSITIFSTPIANPTYSPNLNSPKFPHPIFFPTRKLGPTINTPLLLVDTLDREVLEALPRVCLLLPTILWSVLPLSRLLSLAAIILEPVERLNYFQLPTKR